MTEFYVFYESGALAFTTSDEDYASVWCDENNGYYCCDEEQQPCQPSADTRSARSFVFW